MFKRVLLKIEDYTEIIRIYRKKNRKKIFHLSIPIHGNMGDQAIVYGTNKYLKDNFSQYEIIEIYRKDIYRYADFIKRIIKKDDLIILIGGGNMGNLWIEEEIDRRFIINTFKNNKIISMPQTISFTEDKYGEEEFLKTKEIYNENKKLCLVAREEKSYRIMKKNFQCNKIVLNPDMVLYLSDMFIDNHENRKGIMTCLRSDKESLLGRDKEIFIKELNEEYKDIFVYDTVINKTILKEKRENELMSIFNKFKQSKLVITDRLHGMIFAAITKTPCIVAKSLDHKVPESYQWIKELNYITLVEKLEYKQIKELIEKMLKLSNYSEENYNKKYFENLTKELRNFINE